MSSIRWWIKPKDEYELVVRLNDLTEGSECIQLELSISQLCTLLDSVSRERGREPSAVIVLLPHSSNPNSLVSLHGIPVRFGGENIGQSEYGR